MTDTTINGGGLDVGALFQLFRDGRGRTKSELAALTGMSRKTVSARVDALLDSRLLVPAGSEPSSGGRPPARVAMNTDAGAILALDLGSTHATVAVTDLAGVVIETSSIPIRVVVQGPESALTSAFEAARPILPRALGARPLVGVGVGLPGPVEFATGRPVNPPMMPGWNGFDVRGFVRAEFDVPVLVDNDVNVLAVGERAFAWPSVDDMIYVKVATGLGAGIISGGQLQRGAHGAAGDLGYVQVPYSHTSPRVPGIEVTLGDVATGLAIAAQVARAGVEASSSRDVVRLLGEGNRHAVAATRQAGRDLGEVVATLVNTLNPSVVVIGGSIARAGDHLLAGVREVVYRRASPLVATDLQIVPSRGGDRAGVRGAAMLAIQHVLSAENVERWVSSFDSDTERRRLLDA